MGICMVSDGGEIGDWRMASKDHHGWILEIIDLEGTSYALFIFVQNKRRISLSDAIFLIG